MNKMMIAAAVGAAVGSVVSCGGSTAASDPSTPVEVHDVHVGRITVRLQDPGIQVVDFTNDSSKPCTLVGERGGDGGDGISLSLSCDWSVH